MDLQMLCVAGSPSLLSKETDPWPETMIVSKNICTNDQVGSAVVECDMRGGGELKRLNLPAEKARVWDGTKAVCIIRLCNAACKLPKGDSDNPRLYGVIISLHRLS